MLGEFPPELVQAILQHINASDERIQTLKSLRLTCQTFSQPATALLFKTISILSLQSFERISNIPDEFRNHPKILRISGLIRSTVSIQDVYDWTGGKEGDDAFDARTWYQSNLENNGLSIIDSAEFQSAFHRILQEFPQIRAIEIEESEILEQPWFASAFEEYEARRYAYLMRVLHTRHLAQILQGLFPAMTRETARIHELIVLDKALTFDLAEVFNEGEAAEPWIKPAVESITSSLCQ